MSDSTNPEGRLRDDPDDIDVPEHLRPDYSGVEPIMGGREDGLEANPFRARHDAYVARVARAFHETYERLAPAFGYRTRDESAVPWRDVPEANRNLMLATVRDLIDGGVIRDV